MHDLVQSSSDLNALENKCILNIQNYAKDKIVWRAWGNGPPVLLLHGGSGSWNHWCKNIDALINLGRQLWIPDIPCFGDSDAPNGISDIDQASEIIIDGINQFIGKDKFDLVGFSMGSMGAGYIAKFIATRIKRLVLVAPPALGIEPKESIVIESWEKSADTNSRDQAIRNNLSSLMLSDSAAITDLAMDIHKNNLLKDRMRKRKIYKTPFLREILENLDIPFDCVIGERDALYRGSMNEVKELLMGLGGLRSLEIIPNAGHWVQFEQSINFNQLISRLFLQDVN